MALIMEICDRIHVLDQGRTLAAGAHAVRTPVVEALVGLGFAAKQAEETTDKVLAADSEATTSSALRAALSLLGKTK